MAELTCEEQALAFRFAYLPLPDDAIECEPWHAHDGVDWRRRFLTREWEIAGLWVSVAGEQDRHGRITRWVHVGGEDLCTSADRERLVAAIIEAGQLLDALNQSTDPSTLPSDRTPAG